MSAPKLERKTFQAGDRIFHQGDEANEAYLIESGQIEISRVDNDQTTVVGLVGPGDILGEMALIDDSPRMGTARVVQLANVAVVPRSAFEIRLQKADPVIRRLLQIFVKRLRDQTKVLAEMRASYNTERSVP